MAQLLIVVLGALAGSLAGSVSAFLTSRVQMRRELQHTYDRELKSRRTDAYISLYKRTSNLPRYWPTKPQRSALREWADIFDEWYFREAGGLFLTDPARDAYLSMLDVVASVSAEGRPDEAITDDDVSRLWKAGQGLRRQLASDLGAAELPRVHGRKPAVSPPPKARFGDDDRTLDVDGLRRDKATEGEHHG